MARFAFVTWDGGGNVPPAIGLAQALAARGHQCHFLGYEAQRARIAAQGFAFDALQRSGDFETKKIPGDQVFAQLARHVWACPEHIADIADALSARPADALVIDFMLQGVLAAAEKLRTPAAALVHSALAGLVIAHDSPMAIARVAAANALRSPAGLPLIERTTDAWESLLALVTTIVELDAAAKDAAPTLRYVGPIVEAFANEAKVALDDPGDGRPLVVLSFSTTRFWDQRGRTRNALAALADEPVRVLVTGADTSELTLPANASARSFVPHAQVMPAAAAIVTHCGHGTVTAALAHGVPIVGMPNRAADQPYLARRVAELGAGVALDGEATADVIRAAVRAVLQQPSYRAAARRLGAAIAASPGASGAAAELERIAGEAFTERC